MKQQQQVKWILQLFRTRRAVCLSYCISVLIESEPEISPFILHLPHVRLQCVFFTGQCTNLFQSIAKVNMNSITFCSVEFYLILYFYCRILDLLFSIIRKSCLQHVQQWRVLVWFEFKAHSSADLQVENNSHQINGSQKCSDTWPLQNESYTSYLLVCSNLMNKNYFSWPAASDDLWFHGYWWFWGRAGVPWNVLPLVHMFWPQVEAQHSYWESWRVYAGFSTWHPIHRRLPQHPNSWKDLWVKWRGVRTVKPC